MYHRQLKNFVLLLILHAPALFAQNTAVDSLEIQIDYETIYLLNVSNLERWQRKSTLSGSEKDVHAEIIDLQKEAQLFAETNDFETASLLLDSAIELTRLLNSSSEDNAKVIDTGLPDDSRSTMTRHIISGMDFWQFRDKMVYQLNSKKADASLNPFAGLRLLGNFRVSPSMQLDLLSQLKVSKEYNSAELYLKNTFGAPRGHQFVIEDRFEGTKETHTFDSQYIGNALSLESKFRINDRFNFSIGDDFKLRNYSGKDALSDGYTQNRVYSTAQFSPSISTRMFANYNYSSRGYDKSDSLDYVEHRFDTSLFYFTAQNTSVFLENTWTSRDYYNNIGANSFFNSSCSGLSS